MSEMIFWAAARAAGLDIPRDLSVVSFDNTPLVRFTTPPLTAVDQPIAETTATAVRLLIAGTPTDWVQASPLEQEDAVEEPDDKTLGGPGAQDMSLCQTSVDLPIKRTK